MPYRHSHDADSAHRTTMTLDLAASNTNVITGSTLLPKSATSLPQLFASGLYSPYPTRNND
jgi:hypothetical protein